MFRFLGEKLHILIYKIKKEKNLSGVVAYSYSSAYGYNIDIDML